MSTNLPAIDPNAQPAADPQGQEWWNLPDPNEPPAPAPAAEPPQAPAAAPQPQYFLQAETGTVYKTAEDAARGIAEKDRMIAQQKTDLERAQQLLAAQGIHLGQQPPQQQNDPAIAEIYNALEQDITAVQQGQPNPNRFFALLNQIADRKAQERAQEMFQPFMPFVEHAATTKAVETAGARFDPNIPAFVRSPAYTKTLEKWPALKTAIRTASMNPQYQTEDGRSFGDMLPEFIAQAFYMAKAAAPAAQPIQRPAPQSTTPPQTVQVGVPQGQPLTQPLGWGQFRDPFADAFANVPDIPLTKETSGSSFNPFSG